MQNYQFNYRQYKQKINTKPRVYISLLIVIIILLTGVACFILKTPSYVKFYFVKIDSFYTYSEANKLAIELQEKNAAGYIYFDDGYHVLACVYLNKEDAYKISENLQKEYKNATVLTLKTKKFNKNYKNKEKTAIKNLLSANEDCIENLYSNIMMLEKNQINVDRFKLNLKQISSSYSDNVENFFKTFKNNKNLTAKQNVLTIKETLKDESLNWKAKYNLVKITLSHYSLLEFLS